MANRSDGNVHAIEFREAKPSQGDETRPVSELFSLKKRTVIGNYSQLSSFVFQMLTVSFAVTGANGFLGTALAIAIMESGGDVVCLDLAPKPSATNWG